MIISESEKSRIKSLYGLIKEDAPPSESILVANKNPFKYPEFENARQKYSKDLQNGERFYVSKNLEPIGYGNGRIYNGRLYKGATEKDFTKDFIFFPVFEDLIGKSIRIYENDSIKKIDNFNLSYTDEDCTFSISIKENFFIEIDCDGNVIKGSTGGLLSEPERPLTEDELKNYGGLINYIKSLIEKFVEQVKYYRNKNNWGEIPDEYFEIREIKREKTDF